MFFAIIYRCLGFGKNKTNLNHALNVFIYDETKIKIFIVKQIV